MPVIAIAIVASNGVIGDGTRQPFEYAEDCAHHRVDLGIQAGGLDVDGQES